MRKFIFNGKQVVTQFDDGKAPQTRNVAGEIQRAYMRIEIKEFDDKTRRFKGIATTSTPDRMEDVVDADGAEFKLPIAFLHQHDSSRPVGNIDKAKKVGKEWQVEGYVDNPGSDAPETIRERMGTAWYELSHGLVRGLSIGFNPKEYSFIKETGGIHFTRWEWLELSMVTIPANAEAVITSIKSIARSQLAAPGRKTASGAPPAGASASTTPPKKGSTMKTLKERLAEKQAALETKRARMQEIKAARDTEERESYSDDERSELGNLQAEVKRLDDEVLDLEIEAAQVQRARPISPEQRRAPEIHVKKFKDVDEKFKGEIGLKRAIAHIVSMKELKEGNIVTPAQVAERMFGKTNPTLVAVMKTAVAGGGTDSGEWGAELIGLDNRYTGDFIEFLYGETVYDKLPLRVVPANVNVKGQDGAFTGYFVGQSKAIKVSKGDFMVAPTTPYKAAGLTVVSNEWLTDATPDGLNLCGEGLRKAVAQAVDTLFLSATAVSAGVAPAGILNGVSAINTNGGDAQSIATDIKALFAPFITAKNTSGGFAWVMSPTTALALSLMKNALGQAEYPTLTPAGGTWQGFPVYTGDNIGSGDVILLKPSDVWRIGDTGAVLSISDSAMIEQDDAPTGATDTPVAASATMVSMFQEDSTAIKVVRRVSWGKRRSTAVQFVGDAAYGSEQS